MTTKCVMRVHKTLRWSSKFQVCWGYNSLLWYN